MLEKKVLKLFVIKSEKGISLELVLGKILEKAFVQNMKIQCICINIIE